MFEYFHELLRFGAIYSENGIKQVILGIYSYEIFFINIHLVGYNNERVPL